MSRAINIHSSRASLSWLYGYHVHNLLRAVVLQRSALLHVCIAQQTGDHANHSFQPYILIVAVRLSCTQSAALLRYYSSALLRMCVLSKRAIPTIQFAVHL
jgi:hypothetical protein